MWFSADECTSHFYQDTRQQRVLMEAFQGRLVGELREAVAKDGSGASLKAWLRANVLPDRQLRAQLEAILHPYVLRTLEELRRKAGGNLLVAEVPLHYEIGEVISADLIIVVAASRSVQVRRMMENRGLDEATARAFLNAQLPIETKVEKAEVVIWNDGDPSALECQTLLLANLLNLE
jgi:dephospho-CoA kinase